MKKLAIISSAIAPVVVGASVAPPAAAQVAPVETEQCRTANQAVVEQQSRVAQAEEAVVAANEALLVAAENLENTGVVLDEAIAQLEIRQQEQAAVAAQLVNLEANVTGAQADLDAITAQYDQAVIVQQGAQAQVDQLTNQVASLQGQLAVH